VSGFVAGGGEKKNDVSDETDQESCWGEIRHRHVRLGCRREESKPRRRLIVFCRRRSESAGTFFANAIDGQSEWRVLLSPAGLGYLNQHYVCWPPT
jgi:hypothetical protein